MPKRDNPGQWKPGVSGNKNGRPKIVGEVMELARKWTVQAIATLAEIMQDAASPKAARVAAASAILDRGYGRPIQGITHTGEGMILQIVTGISRAPDEPLTIDGKAEESEGPLH